MYFTKEGGCHIVNIYTFIIDGLVLQSELFNYQKRFKKMYSLVKFLTIISLHCRDYPRSKESISSRNSLFLTIYNTHKKLLLSYNCCPVIQLTFPHYTTGSIGSTINILLQFKYNPTFKLLSLSRFPCKATKPKLMKPVAKLC